jgi:hypothetical protein
MKQDCLGFFRERNRREKDSPLFFHFLQPLTNAFALEVETEPDVFDDFRFWKGCLQSGDLSFEVVSLLVGADPAVADDSGLFSPGTHPDINVEWALTSWGSDGRDCSVIGVLS